MTIPTPTPTPEGKHQVDALTQRFTRAVGFFIVPTPSEGKPSPGTGLLVQFRGKKYLVSALHNFFHDIGGKGQVIRSWEATRFKFRDNAPLERVESLYQAVSRVKSEYGQTLPLSLPEGLLIDTKHDLIVVRVNPSLEEIAHAEFVNLESECFTRELTTGLSLLVVGVTLSSQVNVPGAGPTLVPQLDHVRFDSDLDTSGMTHEWYLPEYFFMPYSLTQDGIAPHGFSGAPVFVNKEPSPGGLWTASPHVVGMALRYFRKKDLLVAVKIRTIIDLLNTDKD
jgi:hypothetical protein